MIDVYYTWIVPNNTIPALTSWVHTATVTQTFAGTEGAWYYGIFDIATNVLAPEGEGYGSMLLVKVTRGNGSYTGEIGILDADSHSQMIQLGSLYPISDE